MFRFPNRIATFISSLSTELWRKAPSVYVNGKEVWDGGGALSEQKTGLLLQWNSTGNTAAAPDPDHTDTESPQGVPVDLLDVCELEKRSEELNKDEMHEYVHKSLRCVNQMEAPAASLSVLPNCRHSLSDVNLSESALKCLEVTNDRDPVMNEFAFPTTEFQSHSDTDNMRSAFNQLNACAEAVVYDDHERASSASDVLAHPRADIFLGFDSDAGNEALGSPVFDLAALLADSQQVQTPAEPGVGWHFPVGLGLSQMCYCPYVQFPDVSYYPALQDNDNIE
ncbi:hypothetical protein M9458_035432, partial [Cirrhinus mrigala]